MATLETKDRGEPDAGSARGHLKLVHPHALESKASVAPLWMNPIPSNVTAFSGTLPWAGNLARFCALLRRKEAPRKRQTCVSVPTDQENAMTETAQSTREGPPKRGAAGKDSRLVESTQRADLNRKQ